MSRQLFGTDGIRGVAGEYPLDPPTVYCVGAALGAWASVRGESPQILIGADTRESSQWIAETMAAGLKAGGARPRFAGLITTPGVAWLTRTDSFQAGVMISASHNPYQDNGIKVFGHSGYKLPDSEEIELEREILRRAGQRPAPARTELEAEESLDLRYLDYLAGTPGADLSGLHIVIDGANGAASHLAPRLFSRLGAKVTTTHCVPDGRNINLDCGAVHPEGLAALVRENHADFGVAFDGDADRAMFAATSGRIVNGDAVLLINAAHMQGCGRLSGNHHGPVVVATVMSNLGLEKALEARGIRLLRTDVGDKYVLEAMLRSEATLGGEQSGHVIFSEFATTGDGMLTALRVAEIVRVSGKNLDELAAELKVYPQRLVNVRIRDRRPFAEVPGVLEEIRAAEASLGAEGRVLVRLSGTEPLARVMVEGRDEAVVNAFADRIAGAIRVALG
ncbi:MAG: phosphoglucosamine mutase [Bryobacteraceae bacterium]